MPQALRYYVYYASEMIGQLYRQLPESRQVGQRSSQNRVERADTIVHLHGEGEPLPSIRHAGLEGSHSRFSEALFDKNDMYQLEQVMGRLRKQLRGAAQCRPGNFMETGGCFSLDLERDAPEGSLWLAAPGLRLLCATGGFSGETEEAWRALWACGEALPLRGVVLCLGRRDGGMCGLPLYLAM